MPRTAVLLTLLLGLTACRAVGAEGTSAVEMTTIAYVTGPDADPVKHRLDLFRPGDRTDLPVLIFLHGGVWQHGDKDRYRHIGEAFARRGIVTAVVNYRLTPGVRHPVHAQDAARAVAWVMRHAQEYGARSDCVFISGHSAGGHLAALLLFDARYLRAEGVDPDTFGGVIPLSGIFDLTGPIDATEKGGFAAYIHPPFGADRRTLEAASPIRYLRGTRVPLLVVLAGEDYKAMRRQSTTFVEALRRQKIPTAFETVAGRGHFDLVNKIGNEGDPTTDLIARFVTEPRSFGQVRRAGAGSPPR